MQNRLLYPIIGYPNCDPVFGQTHNPACYPGETCLFDRQSMKATCIKPTRANGGIQSKYLELLMLNLDCFTV